MADEVCAGCGKNEERLTVREGDQRFQLDGYVLHKRRKKTLPPCTQEQVGGVAHGGFAPQARRDASRSV
jgi:hypothetical protein